jgi:hypothetical protein
VVTGGVGVGGAGVGGVVTGGAGVGVVGVPGVPDVGAVGVVGGAETDGGLALATDSCSALGAPPPQAVSSATIADTVTRCGTFVEIAIVASKQVIYTGTYRWPMGEN